MPCPLCGEICRCSSGEYSDALPRWLPSADAALLPATTHPGPEPESAEIPPSLIPDANPPDDRIDSGPEDSSAWRQEVASRLNRYQARRKPRPPRYPSLRLRFEEDIASRTSCDASASAEAPVFAPAMPIFSNQALALDRFVVDHPDHEVELRASGHPALAQIQAQEAYSSSPRADKSTQQAAAPIPVTAKIIEFPRSWTPPPAPLDELAEPVTDRPRILEAPEIVPPPPALGGITIEPVQQQEVEKLRGIDIPQQITSLARRIFSSAIDGVIVAAACIIFAAIFWKMTAFRPPRLQIMGLAGGLFGLFWAAYQYLLMVYSGTTPGLRLAGIELARFDGDPADRRLRRWRVLASFLSAISLGMGYAWVLLDEDSLCWHDRITHTCLAPRQRERL